MTVYKQQQWLSSQQEWVHDILELNSIYEYHLPSHPQESFAPFHWRDKPLGTLRSIWLHFASRDFCGLQADCAGLRTKHINAFQCFPCSDTFRYRTIRIWTCICISYAYHVHIICIACPHYFFNQADSAKFWCATQLRQSPGRAEESYAPRLGSWTSCRHQQTAGGWGKCWETKPAALLCPAMPCWPAAP